MSARPNSRAMPAALAALPRLYDEGDDLGFDEDLVEPADLEPATLPGTDAVATGIRTFFDSVVRELETAEAALADTQPEIVVPSHIWRRSA